MGYVLLLLGIIIVAISVGWWLGRFFIDVLCINTEQELDVFELCMQSDRSCGRAGGNCVCQDKRECWREL